MHGVLGNVTATAHARGTDMWSIAPRLRGVAHRWGLRAPSAAWRDLGRRWQSAPALDVAHETDDAPAAFTSDMRPPGDTSRKWVKVDSLGRAYATGRRKTAVARVWLWPTADQDLASVRINHKSLASFFGGHWVQRHTVLAPFFETGTAGKYSVMATVKGGGINGVPPPHTRARLQSRSPRDRCNACTMDRSSGGCASWHCNRNAGT